MKVSPENRQPLVAKRSRRVAAGLAHVTLISAQSVCRGVNSVKKAARAGGSAMGERMADRIRQLERFVAKLVRRVEESERRERPNGPESPLVRNPPPFPHRKGAQYNCATMWSGWKFFVQ
jgi:hypothetical protein